MQDHQEMFENIPAYALGALDPTEAEVLAAHIASCSECQVELRQYQRTTEQLGLAVGEHSPSAEIKERLFAQIESSQQPEMQKRPLIEKRWYSRQSGLTLVSVGLVLLLAVSNLLLWNQLQDLRSQAFKVINLSATDYMPDAAGMIVISADGKYGTLVASGMASLPQDLQYQLWLIKDGERTSGGVFSVPGSGYTALKVYSPQPLVSYDDFGITIEPYGGSPGPTGDKVLGVEY
jgi:anti-sigma-K factor RskA